MKKIFFILLFILISTSYSFADKTHAFSLKEPLQFSGGELLFDTAASLQSFFIRPNWTNSLEVVSSWQGFDNSRKIGKSLGSLQILKPFIFNGKLILIASQNNMLLLIELDSALNQSNSVIIEKFEDNSELRTVEVKIKDKHSFLLQVNETLFYLEKYSELFTVNEIAGNINNFCVINGFGGLNYASIEKYTDFNVLTLFDKSYENKGTLRISAGEIIELQQFRNFIVSKSTIVGSNYTLLEFISIHNMKILESKYFECSPENIVCTEHTPGNLIISYLTFENKINFSNFCEFNSENFLHNFRKSELPSELYEPICLRNVNSLYFVIFRNFLVAYDEDLGIRIFEQLPFGKLYQSQPDIKIYRNNLIISSKYMSEKFIIKSNPLWFFFSLINYLAVYLIPVLFFLLAYFFYRKYRKQKKLLDELINLPNAGLMIILNKNSEITKLNQQARELLGIDASIPLQKPIAVYLTLDYVKVLNEFLAESIALHQNASKRIVIRKDNHNFEFIFNISPIWSLSGTLKGYVINGFDITEQLERKRLSNWAQLAHDMQTNLITIKLNAEQITSEQHTENSGRIGKILYQVNLLQRRVRDIVTVGRTMKLELMNAHSLEILLEARNEFDKEVFPNISFLSSGYDFEIFCDKPKLVRAVRNAIENGIKAIPNQTGSIELNCWIEPHFSCFLIKDSGVGMDENVKKKILTPFFTTSKDGSGFGLGTMIIQQVVELHHGKIQINSEPGKGTEFILKIPRNLMLKEN